MKKNIIKSTLVAIFALFVGYNVYSSQNADLMSDLALANVEALADHGETSGEWKQGYEVSSYMAYIQGIPGLTDSGWTSIPCCKRTNNQYSACSAVDICPNV